MLYCYVVEASAWKLSILGTRNNKRCPSLGMSRIKFCLIFQTEPICNNGFYVAIEQVTNEKVLQVGNRYVKLKIFRYFLVVILIILFRLIFFKSISVLFYFNFFFRTFRIVDVTVSEEQWRTLIKEIFKEEFEK